MPGGGFPRNRLYLIEGDPGTGKTTLGLRYLQGVRHGDAGLYVTLSETAQELHAVAASHGWSLEGLAIHELTDEAGVSRRTRRRVLVVEDNDDLREMMRFTLELQGHSAHAVASGDEALAVPAPPRRGAGRHRAAGHGRLRGRPRPRGSTTSS